MVEWCPSLGYRPRQRRRLEQRQQQPKLEWRQRLEQLGPNGMAAKRPEFRQLVCRCPRLHEQQLRQLAVNLAKR